jgi:fermentation-respiration switch protein FrsA (DUF1100 family)
VFALGTAVLAAHAVVDSFLAPEPGTGWRDHVLRGAVSLGVLAAGVVLYRRSRPGLRAALALVLGVLALEGAVLAVADARAVGARGEDWTGFLLLPAGLALCASGAVLLWRSRKASGRRHLRRALLVLGSLLAAYWILLPVAIAIGVTHRPRAEVDPAALGRPHEAVTIRTADGLGLAAWYVPSRNGAAIVTFPTRRGSVPEARMLARHGYGVLLVDMRGYDGSEGDPNMFGWGSTPDVDAAVAWLLRRPDVRDGRIGGLGLSVGGEMMLQAAAGNEGLRAVVSEGAGVRSVREHLLYGTRGWLSLPQQAVQTAALTVMSETAPPASLEDLVSRVAPRPLFLIHAEHGRGGEELNTSYFDAARRPKEIWRVEDSGHTGGLDARPVEYERRVVGFFDRALAPRTAER